eukprot:748475-Ditylum_brightwellii.AAC.1
MDPAKYATRTTGVACAASPTHPGMYDANIATNSGSVVQSRCKAEHKQWIEDRMIEKAVLQVCKIQLGQIDDDLVDEYINNFNALINMTQGFNTYIEQQEECRDFFSDAQQPITDQKLSDKGQLQVRQT